MAHNSIKSSLFHLNKKVTAGQCTNAFLGTEQGYKTDSQTLNKHRAELQIQELVSFGGKTKKMPSLEQNRGTRPSTTLNHTKQAAGCCGRGRGPVFVVGMGLREPTMLLGHIWAVALLTA